MSNIGYTEEDETVSLKTETLSGKKLKEGKNEPVNEILVSIW